MVRTSGAAAGLPEAKRGYLKLTMGLGLGLLLVGVVLLRLGGLSFLTQWFLLRQDIPLLTLGLVIARFAAVRLRDGGGPPVPVGGGLVLSLAALLVLGGWLGHRFLLMGYDMSRDEQMATFDAVVFAQGRLVEPLAAMWRENAAALNLLFMYTAQERVAWISSYLPMNSAIRAVFAVFDMQALASPVLSAVGLVALWRCVRRLWPQDSGALAIALVLYCTSGAVLVNAMTSYATTAHLALNLVWLALLLRGDARGDLGAILAAFVATGLHQPLPHPLFALPVLLLVARRDWRRGAVFFVAYCGICGFWLWWPHLVGPMVTEGAAAAPQAGLGFLSRLAGLFAQRDGLGLSEMGANLLRFVAWQHVLLVPLCCLALPLIRKEPMALALAGGVGLTVFAMAVILPYQGHGFGYRYLHGLIGNMVLLAVYGWRQVRGDGVAWRGYVRSATVLTAVVLLPLQAWMAHRFYAPYAQTRAALLATDADYVVVGVADVPFSADLVFNPPALDHRPVLLLREGLKPEGRAAICASGPTVAFAGAAMLGGIAAYYGVAPRPGTEAKNVEAARLLEAEGCWILP
ncbi:hypothetical protein [Paragemmobacter straminiformis]|uniref:Dolichyl-phosphate-mannose-protein mannosyltransferase n=1 Tax=Paragemmobacter straminiformis TaxID=2045119 RepID=A0A842I7R1_9RHOB|nr:hypothetical protein [Gemmobacter straminiformis]MBC2835028.1 hypothetical protein [Gemmobacter straminiformis]